MYNYSVQVIPFLFHTLKINIQQNCLDALIVQKCKQINKTKSIKISEDKNSSSDSFLNECKVIVKQAKKVMFSLFSCCKNSGILPTLSIALSTLTTLYYIPVSK